MKIAGFSFVRNAEKFDYPVIESITSILPICDIFVIAVGKSDDDTLSMVKSIHSDKIKIIETVWDDTLREGGNILAVETNKAFSAIHDEFDWAFYIQADEVVHENHLSVIQQTMQLYKDNPKVDGLLFNYSHFFGSYDYIGTSSNYYSHEIRIIRNDKNFYSYRDAQGFRKYKNQKLNVKPVNACIHHYGWVRNPKKMTEKIRSFHKLYNNDDLDLDFIFSYGNYPRGLQKFRGTHPKVMQDLISKKNWYFDYDISFSNRISTKDRAKKFLKRMGIDTYYKNYKII